MEKSRSMDMLNGSLWDKILKFSLTLAAGSMLQQLFNAADVIVVGRFAGKHAMAAVGSNGALICLMVTLFVGMSIGANVLIARYIGEGNSNRAGIAVHTAISISVICGIVAGLIGVLMSKSILVWMQVPENVLELSVLYMRIYFAGLPLMLLYNFEAAIFRSVGDTTTPLVALFIGGIINVALNLFFVIILGMSVAGVGLATVIANGISAFYLLKKLMKRDDAIRFQFSKLCISKKILIKIIYIGVPAGFQGLVFSLSNVLIQSSVNSLGTDVMAGVSAAVNLENVLWFLMNAFGQAAVSFIGQNYGAGDFQRCRRIVRLCMVMDFICTGIMCFFFIVFSEPLLGLFNKDPQVIYYGAMRVKIMMSVEVIDALIEVMSGVMRGLGRSLTPALISFVGICLFRIVWIYSVFKVKGTFFCLMISYPISWVITLVALMIAYYIMIKKIRRSKDVYRKIVSE